MPEDWSDLGQSAVAEDWSDLGKEDWSDLGAKPLPEPSISQRDPYSVSTTAGGPQRNTDILASLRNEPSPDVTGAVVSPFLVESAAEPHTSLLGITPEKVPQGQSGVGRVGRSLQKVALGAGEFVTSPAGIAETITAMTPARLLVTAKWIADMAGMAGGAAGNLSVLVNKPDKTPEDWQQISDHTVNTAVGLLASGKLASVEAGALTGVRAPVGRLAEPKQTRLSKDLAQELDVAELQRAMTQNQIPKPAQKPPAEETKLESPEELQRQLNEELGGQPWVEQPNTSPKTVPEGQPTKTIVGATGAPLAESAVKLPSQYSVEKLTDQLNLFNSEIGEALTSGGRFLPKEMRPDVAKGAPAEGGTVVSKSINQHFVDKLVTIRREFNKAQAQMLREADPASTAYFNGLKARFEEAFRQVQELRRASHESLYFWNKIQAEYQEIARAAGHMPEIKKQLPIIDQMWKDMRNKEYIQAGKRFVDYLRMNLFTLGSWTLDFGTNLVATASRAPAWALMDATHFVTGKPHERMASALRAITLNARNWIPTAKRFRLPQRIESELGTTAGGEMMGQGKEVMVDFSQILPNNPELAKRLKNADYVLGGPVRLKRAVDNFFGRLGATAELYNRAYTEGRLKGLKGDDLKLFVDEFMNNPPELAITEAVKTGKEFKFNRDLSPGEEWVSSNVFVKGFLEAFPRWTFQFVRWAGEMIGADPGLLKRMVRRQATPEEVVTYLSKAATGWGAIYFFNQTMYDNVDSNTMEYVTEEGDRIRLSGRTPLPEIYMLVAMLRGDDEKAKAALAHVSLPGAKLVSGEPAGVFSGLIDTMRESMNGRYTAEQTTRELTKMVNNALPGKSVLGAVRAVFDPTIREGVGAPIPGVSSMLPQPVDPTTGDPRTPKQRIPGTSIEFPTVAGTPFPGAVRVLNEVEEALLNHGIIPTRPRRTSIIELPAEDVPVAVRREYEQRVGRYVKQFITAGIANEEWKTAPFDVRRELLMEWTAMARRVAKAEMAEKYGTSMNAVQPTPLNIQRMPERLTR